MEYTSGLSVLFTITTFITVGLFFVASKKHLVSLLIIVFLGLLQGLLAWKGFFLDSEAFPPRPTLLLPPSILIIVFAFYSKPGRRLIERMDLKMMTLLSIIRIPVEIVLLQLFLEGLVPESMTFEGRNFDILSGISAPIVAWLAFRKGKINTKLLLGWNVLALILLFQVVSTAIVSFPGPFQLAAFDQPNIGVLQFPFVWLPGIVVPIVAFTHIVSIHKLRKMVDN